MFSHPTALSPTTFLIDIFCWPLTFLAKTHGSCGKWGSWNCHGLLAKRGKTSKSSQPQGQPLILGGVFFVGGDGVLFVGVVVRFCWEGGNVGGLAIQRQPFCGLKLGIICAKVQNADEPPPRQWTPTERAYTSIFIRYWVSPPKNNWWGCTFFLQQSLAPEYGWAILSNSRAQKAHTLSYHNWRLCKSPTVSIILFSTGSDELNGSNWDHRL